MANPDVIVLGVGAMGSAACWELARRGARVVGLDPFAPGHDRGSSHGESRIIRQAYFEHPNYVPLLRRAYEGWAELEREAGRRLFHRTGLLLSGSADGAVISGVRRAAAEHALTLESPTRAEAARRFPVFRTPEDHHCLFEPDAGWLPVERCVQTMAELAQRRGATLRPGTRATAWRVDRDGVEVRTDDGVLRAARLVIAAGAWTGRLLGSAALPLSPRRKMQMWFRADNPALAESAGCPVFCFDLPAGFYYGFPATETGEIKVARHDGGRPVDDPDRLDRLLCAEDVEPVAAFLRACIPSVDPQPVRHSACMYTMTPDEHFFIDRHPDHEQIALAAGFSGHGFKFAPLVGALLADLALGGRIDPNAEFLSLARLRSR